MNKDLTQNQNEFALHDINGKKNKKKEKKNEKSRRYFVRQTKT